jgi:hypothetical protein
MDKVEQESADELQLAVSRRFGRQNAKSVCGIGPPLRDSDNKRTFFGGLLRCAIKIATMSKPNIALRRNACERLDVFVILY